MILCLILTVVWLVANQSRTKREIEMLERHVAHIEMELFALRQTAGPVRSEGPTPGDAPAGTTSSSSSVARSPELVTPTPFVRNPPPVPPVAEPRLQPQHPILDKLRDDAPALISLGPDSLASGAPPVLAGGAVPAEASGPKPRSESLPQQHEQPFNWERFLGSKMYAWIGGFAFFVGILLAIKYSFEHNLISPQLRMVAGFVTGLGLLVGGVLLKRKAYEITSQTLCATGVLVLYAVTFACHALYSFTGVGMTFLLMVLVTATAFLLAVRMDAMVIAVLGLVGGFLTPPLLSTGVDRPLGLFGYVALLDIGLMAVALRRRWHFLVGLGALGTVAIELGWMLKFFASEKLFVAMGVFLAFSVLFCAAYALAQKLDQDEPWLLGSAIAMPLFAFLDVAWVMGERPGVVFSFLLGADLCLLATLFLRPQAYATQLVAAGGSFLILCAWTSRYLTNDLLGLALIAYFVFAILHAVFPLVLQRVRPGHSPVWWSQLFPPLALLLVLAPFLKELSISWIVWPFILMVDLLAIGLAFITASLLGIVAVLLLTMLVAAVWIAQIPAEITGLPPILFVVGGFGVFFFVVGLFAGEKIMARLQASAGGGAESGPLQTDGSRAQTRAQIPALAAILPFVLLIMAAVRLPITDPSTIYGLALLFGVLLLGITRLLGIDLLVPVALGCTLALEHSWDASHFSSASPMSPLVWNILFTLLFTAYPFLFARSFASTVLPWASAALAGPLHFYLVYHVIERAFPNQVMGLLPAAFALPALTGLVFLARASWFEQRERNRLLAWFGGSALFFITLIFPIQFDRQWITLGWALEGVALIWFFHRVPQPGLRLVGTILLVVAFVRLAFNPEVLHYQVRSTVPVFNWYLYAYTIGAVSMMAGARLLAPPRNRVLGKNAPPILYTLGGILAFLLLNIEIADYYSAGTTLTLDFSTNFARDMTYSIAWAMFALILLAIGVARKLPGARYPSMALLGVTILKLFFHDLVHLDALYRIGAFLGVAVISILASVLYQKLFAGQVADRAPTLSTQKQ